jgi:predicted RNase H-like HicB family nuclease
MKLRYTVVFEEDEDRWIVASAPALGCAAQGRTRKTALRRLREAVESYVLARRSRGWAIPRESEDNVSEFEISI